jgi:ABC-type transport system substrate-binding protein
MKRLLVWLVALCMICTMFAGCSGPEPEGTETGGNGSSEATKRTDLNLALVGVVSTLDPFASSLTVDLMLYRQIYESFYYVDDYGQTHPRLALDHEISSDGLEYTFYLREDAFFHNGEPVKADDAVFSFQKAMESGVLAPYVNVVSKVEKVDDYTVKITLKQPYTPFLANTMQVCIVNEKAYTEAGDTFGSTITGAGTGPYKVTIYDGNTKIELTAFDKYYRGEADIKTVTFIPMADRSTGLIAFQNGELDFYEIPTANWEEISSSGKYNCVLNPTSHISYILINPNKGILRNQDLRYAIQYAIDREAINIIAYEGLATPAYHMMHPEYIFGASEDNFKFTYDPEKAKEYLAKAGYPDGVDIGVLQHTTANYYPKIAQTFQAQLAEVGITCTLEGGETSALVSGWRAGEFELLNSGFNAVLDYDYFTRYTSPAVSTSFLKYQDSEYDADWILEMYNKGAAELDPEKRKEIYFELDEYISRTACYIPIFYKTLPYAWDKNLDVKLDLNYYYVYDWAWK